ncbi:MAG: hypothetical protein VYA69_05655 [Gemmatimonadota bacterium]|nr:hypothetical protein [Gemmatimonadota bacterium]
MKTGAFVTAMILSMVAGVVSHAQESGQPASDVLMQFDMWGNPTPRGGVTNNGPNSHSVW